VKVFISYARRDAPSIARLSSILDQLGVDVWYDSRIVGGQLWWDEILTQIRACDVFMFCVSPESLRSRAARAELSWATTLARPIVPVLVAPANLDAVPSPLDVTNIVDFHNETGVATAALIRAVQSAPAAPALPDPLPSPPDPPVSDLGPLREQLDRPSLDYAEQNSILEALRRHVDDVDQDGTLLDLLGEFRARPDIVEAVGREVDGLIRVVPESSDDDIPRRRAPSERDAGANVLLTALVTHLRDEHLTPILGFGLSESFLGTRRWLARQWAKTFEFPLSKRAEDDVPSVAQFVSAMTNPDTLLSSMRDFLAKRLVASGLPMHDDEPLTDLIRAAWARRKEDPSPDPHTVVAQLGCPIYVNTSPWTLLTDALRAEGREPVVELCRWRADAYDWAPSPLESEPDYRPSAQRPLVFQAFGSVEEPESLVVTEDDYFDYVIAVTENRALVPTAVRRALADSALVLLGFELQSWDVRILLRTLLGQEGNRKLRKYAHVAAQIDLSGDVLSPDGARRYLERYFGKVNEPSIDIYWGSVDDFVEDLAALLPRSRSGNGSADGSDRPIVEPGRV
jgi:hypothetical protein